MWIWNVMSSHVIMGDGPLGILDIKLLSFSRMSHMSVAGHKVQRHTEPTENCISHHAMLSLSSDGPFDSFFTFLTPSPMAVEVVTLKLKKKSIINNKNKLYCIALCILKHNNGDDLSFEAKHA